MSRSRIVSAEDAAEDRILAAIADAIRGTLDENGRTNIRFALITWPSKGGKTKVSSFSNTSEIIGNMRRWIAGMARRS